MSGQRGLVRPTFSIVVLELPASEQVRGSPLVDAEIARDWWDEGLDQSVSDIECSEF